MSERAVETLDADARAVRVWPLHAAGFTTAFGAHAVAADLSRVEHGPGSLLDLGALLAVYDGAEVVLKPVFGHLSDRIGPRPVLLGGLVAFAAASAFFVLAGGQSGLWLARLVQGAAASAFSPAASSMVAQVAGPQRRGRAFGSYGSTKSLGYTTGPLIGGAVVAVGGLETLFAVLAVLAAAVAVVVTVLVPSVAPMPRRRQTVLDLVRDSRRAAFWRPTATLAAGSAALSVGVGFLPVVGAHAGLGPVATGAAVSVLAAMAALVQPAVGRRVDSGRLPVVGGMLVGLMITAVGLALACLPGVAGMLCSAVLVGVGTGVVTPIGFTALAASARPERLGATMGTAELGRELGDAGGPLLVALTAGPMALSAGFLSLAAVTALMAVVVAAGGSRSSSRR